MLLSQIEYEILRPIYHGEPQKFDKTDCRDAIEYLLSNNMIERISVKDDESCADKQYRITTLGRQAYEECENYLDDEKRKDATLKTAKEANNISRGSKRVSIIALIVAISGFFLALGSFLYSILK